MARMASFMGSEAETESRRNNYPLMMYSHEDWLKQEKWHKYYSSFQSILFVGEGDFSFSLCLAKSFGSASNIVATCLDSKDELISKYKKAKENVECLEKLGATVLFGIDVTNMKSHFRFRMKKFDRIVYNFPHSGFQFHGKYEYHDEVIRKHQRLVYDFFRNARNMLRPDGEVHVNHKTTTPFSLWDLPDLATRNHLLLFKCIEFKIEDFPGYCNKRGDGSRCDVPFPLGECSTFMFFAPDSLKGEKSIPFPIDSPEIVMPHLPYPFGERETVPTPPLGMFSSMDEYYETRREINMRNEYNRSLVRLFGKPAVDVMTYHVHEGMRHGLKG